MRSVPLTARISMLMQNLEDAWQLQHFEVFREELQSLIMDLHPEVHNWSEMPPFTACVQHRRLVLRHLREALQFSQQHSPKPLGLIHWALLEAHRAL